jgi:uncharacterized protein YlxW (UPF0749 family)
LRYPMNMVSKRWYSIITVLLSVAFGLFLGYFLVQGRVLFRVKDSNAIAISDLRAELSVEKAKYEQLATRQQELELRKRTLLQIDSDNPSNEALYEAWREYALLSGMTDVTGSGIRLTLDDKLNYDPLTDPIESLIHDTTVTYAMNLLWAAGARAMTLNGTRMTAVSNISCVGPTILSYDVRLMPPYEIEAIGPADSMRQAVESDSWFARLRQKEIGVRITLSEEASLILPSFSKTHDFRAYMDLLIPIEESLLKEGL